MKKIMSCILTLMMIFTFNTGIVDAATVTTETDIVVSNYSISRDTIYKGVDFDLNLKLTNMSGSTITEMYIINLSSSFYSQDKGDVIVPSSELRTLNDGETNSYKMHLIYNGGINTTFSFKVKYKTTDESGNTIDVETAPMNIGLNAYAGDPTSGGSTSEPEKNEPKLNILNNSIPNGNAGGRVELNLELKNSSSYSATNVVVKPSLEGTPFEATEMSLSRSFDKISANKSVDLNYIFKIKPDTTPNTYPITLQYDYNNGLKSSETIYVKVAPGYSTADLIVSKITKSIEEVKAGNNIEVSFNIKNNGEFYAKDISVSLLGLDSKGFTLANGVNNKTISLLMGRTGEEIVKFNLHANSDMAGGNYPLKAHIQYKDSENNVKTKDEEFFIKVTPKDDINLAINNIKAPSDKVVPGENFEVSFDVLNNSSSKAEDLIVTVDGGESIIPKSQNIVVINELAAGAKKSLTFKMQPVDNAAPRSYLLNIEVKNNKNEIIKSIRQYIGIEVAQKSDIAITNITNSTSVAAPNEPFTVSFDVENNGLGTAKNLKVTVDAGDKLICKSQSIQMISSLGSKEKKRMSFQLEALEEAEAKNYPISINVEYDGRPENSVKQYSGIYIEGVGSSKSVPKIIINKYQPEPSIVKAGSNFDIELSFLNTNRVKTVRNIKVYLTVDEKSSETGNVFTPVNSSNTFYIDEIAPKGVANKKLTMFTIPDAKSKTYTVTANIEYEDDKGNQYTAQELIGIPVAQPSELKTSDIQLPSEAYMRQPIPLYIEVYNTGKVTMSNFMVKVEGDFDVQSGSSFIGNIEPGAIQYYDADLMAKKTGQLKGEIIFSYDEPNGEHKEIRKEISVNAMEMQKPENPVGEGKNVNPMGQNDKGSKVKVIASVLGGAIVLLIVGVIIVKRRKRKKGLTLDE